jgi:hypothetical protein
MADPVSLLLKRCPKSLDKKNPITNKHWYAIRPEDVKKLTQNQKVVIEVMQKDKGIIFAGFGIVSNVSKISGKRELSLIGFKEKSTGGYFKNSNRFKVCENKKVCVLNVSKKKVHHELSMNIKLQIFKIDNTANDISALVYLNCEQSGGNNSSEKFIRKRENILASKRFN